MSGRTRWRRDGQWVTGHRKTDRRQHRRDPRVKLLEVAKTPGPDKFPARVAFSLPKTLHGFVASGPHGVGVQVLASWFVRIGGHSADQCFMTAQTFFAAVAADRPAFTTRAVVVKDAEPGNSYSVHFTVV